MSGKIETQPWMSAPQTKAVMAALTAEGAKALFVGGCVRNTLLGRPVDDIDIATEASPQNRDRAAGKGEDQSHRHRHRARHHHRRHRSSAFRDHHLAARCGNLRPQGAGRVHRRLAGRRQAARLHLQRALLRRQGRALRSVRRSRRSEERPRALRRLGRRAHRRRLSARLPLLPFPRLVRQAAAGRGSDRCHWRRSAVADRPVRRARAEGNAEAAGRARSRRRCRADVRRRRARALAAGDLGHRPAGEPCWRWRKPPA